MCYKVSLVNLRRLLEGAKYISTNKGKTAAFGLPVIPDSVQQFFNEVDIKKIYTINEHHNIINYTFKRKLSEDSSDEEVVRKKSYNMLVSYMVLGSKSDRACISMFEYDVKENAINPNNFIIITQKINKEH